MFVGVVREHDHGGPPSTPSTTPRTPASPDVPAPGGRRRWPTATPSSPLAAVHRVGHLEIGDLAVVVAVQRRPPRRGVRGLPRPHRHAQGAGADLEAPAVQRRLRRVGGAAVTRRHRRGVPVTPGIASATAGPRPAGPPPRRLFVGFVLIALAACRPDRPALRRSSSPARSTNTLGEVQGNEPSDPGQRRPDLPDDRRPRLHHGGRHGRPRVPGHRLGPARGRGRPQARHVVTERAVLPEGHHQQAGRGGEHRRDGRLPAGGDRRRARATGAKVPEVISDRPGRRTDSPSAASLGPVTRS